MRLDDGVDGKELLELCAVQGQEFAVAKSHDVSGLAGAVEQSDGAEELPWSPADRPSRQANFDGTRRDEIHLARFRSVMHDVFTGNGKPGTE